MPGEKLKLGVLVSGRGSNLQAILDAVEEGRLDAEIALVVCNHRGAGAIERAKKAGAAVEVHELREYGSRESKQKAIGESLERAGAELIVCAGWDRVFVPEFIERFRDRIINIHPSLLPAFGGGLHAVRDAFEYGVKWAGCTVHFVTEAVDAGPIIVQAPVPVLDDDTEETLAERIHIEEHRILIDAIRLYGEGRIKVRGRKVSIEGRWSDDRERD